MNRFIMTTFALVTGFFALIASLILAIPLAIAALITGKKIEKQLKASAHHHGQRTTIEGEFEEVTKP